VCMCTSLSLSLLPLPPSPVPFRRGPPSLSLCFPLSQSLFLPLSPSSLPFRRIPLLLPFPHARGQLRRELGRGQGRGCTRCGRTDAERSIARCVGCGSLAGFSSSCHSQRTECFCLMRLASHTSCSRSLDLVLTLALSPTGSRSRARRL
jgi:hypothetical protein